MQQSRNFINVSQQGVTIELEEPENHTSGRYETDQYNTLRIRSPVPSDSGKYTCIATNPGGVAEASAMLQVLSKYSFD